MSLRFKSEAELNAHMRRGVPVEIPRRKYGGERTVADGITFDSKFECKRYGELKAMQAVGLISQLEVHPSYALHVGSIRIGAICPDFEYMRSGERILEDTKSPATAKKELYVWKRNHLLAEYGLKITEIVKRRRG